MKDFLIIKYIEYHITMQAINIISNNINSAMNSHCYLSYAKYQHVSEKNSNKPRP